MKNLVSKIVNIYTVIFIIGFPLIMTDKYYSIQEDKLYFTIFLTAAAVIVIFAALLIYAASHKGGTDKPRTGKARADSAKAGKAKAGAGKTEIQKAQAANADANKAAAPKGSFKELLNYISGAFGVPCCFATAFLAVVIISTIFSNWRFEAFWGNVGRSQGLYSWLFYFTAYMLVALFYTPKKRHIDIFIAVGMVVCAWGILDYLYLSPIGWQEGIDSYEILDFSSTIGNINLLTAVEGIYLLSASAMFISETDVKMSVFYYAAALLAFMALIAGFSDNAILSIATAFCFLPFYAFRNRQGIMRYSGLTVGYIAMMLAIGLMRVDVDPPWDFRHQHRGILQEICIEHVNAVMVMLGVAVVVYACLSVGFRLADKKRSQAAQAKPAALKAGRTETAQAEAAQAEKVSAKIPQEKTTRTLRCIWAGLGVMAAIAVIAILYDANTGGHPELYKPLKNILIFDDDWGTNRGFNWRLMFTYMKSFPLFKLLVGTGPETYAAYTISYDYDLMMERMNRIFDSPHNEPLQYLFTTGILGFLSYYGLTVSAMVTGCKAKTEELRRIGTALTFALLAFTFVSIVNISTPNVTPFVVVCLAMCTAAGREQEI